ncbi:MAG: type I 3-dehydroquinate dehydratase [Verrucomicrobiota bacterium]
MPRIRRIKWSTPCLSVGTITTPEGLRYLQRRETGSDLIEVRVDSLRAAEVEEDEIVSRLKKRKSPVLLTLRTTIEGGEYPWKSTERINLFEKLIPYGDAVDLELHNMRYVQPLLQQARDLGKGVILSTHSIQRKITYGKAVRLIDEFRKYRVQVYKMATLVRTKEDLRVLVQLLIEFPHLRLGLMGVGPLADLSRQVLPLVGSKLVYGYLDEAAAPGQPPIGEVTTHLPLVNH